MSTACLQPVAILWDIENCAVPHDVNSEDVAVHIRLTLKVQLAMKGPIIVFSAYGDYSHLPRHTRHGCHKTGVNLIDLPQGKKDLVDKAILVDMFQFALDNPPPCTVLLISGDDDFAPALHKLGRRGYCIVLAMPFSSKVSPALCNACQHLWSWPDVARGKLLNLEKSPSICMTKDCKPLEAAMQNDKPPKIVAPNAKNDCIDLAKGKGHAKAEGVEGNTLESGPSGNQNGNENSRKIPVAFFEEHIKVPFFFAKESTEIPFVTSNSMTGGVASCKFAPPNDQYVCDRFAVSYPENAFLCPFLQGSISGSQNAQRVSANSTHVTPARKQAAHVKSKGPTSQLKVKKKKMKKTKEGCSSSQKKKKMKQIKEHCVIGAAPDATPKLSKKQRKAARLAALQ